MTLPTRYIANTKEMIMMKKMFIVVLLSSVALLTGCHTVQGLGKDVQKGGEKLEKSAS